MKIFPFRYKKHLSACHQTARLALCRYARIIVSSCLDHCFVTFRSLCRHARIPTLLLCFSLLHAFLTLQHKAACLQDVGDTEGSRILGVFFCRQSLVTGHKTRCATWDPTSDYLEFCVCRFLATAPSAGQFMKRRVCKGQFRGSPSVDCLWLHVNPGSI